ncbi:MAG TPA: hypothetical protein DCM32_08590 [Xanthomonadaceae bacterium]|nr:hypothetical protein [Xanthomonadaceae bacterium]
MGSLSSPGIGSGLNVNQLVSQLVAAERAPSDSRIARQEANARADLAAFGQVRGALSALQAAANALDGAGGSVGRRTVVQANAGFSASASNSTALGRYSIEVRSLATAHKLQSAAPGVSESADLGTGTISFTVGSDTFNVSLGPSTTLAQLRDAINTATRGRGLSATIVRGDSGSVLVLNAATSGTAGAISLPPTTTGSIAGFIAGLSVTTPAANAEVRIDGVTRTSSSNRLTDAIAGVTLDLSRAETGTAYALDIAADNVGVRAAVQSFIGAYNSALGTLRTVSAVNPATGSAAALAGDSAVRGVQAQLRGLIGGAFAELSALGIRSSKDGSLTLDAARLDETLAVNPSAVSALFDKGNLGSVGARLGAQLQGAVEPNTGLFEARTKALNERMRGLQADRERLDARMSRIEEGYRRQFTALDGLVAQLQSTQSFLTRELARLPGASS